MGVSCSPVALQCQPNWQLQVQVTCDRPRPARRSSAGDTSVVLLEYCRKQTACWWSDLGVVADTVLWLHQTFRAPFSLPVVWNCAVDTWLGPLDSLCFICMLAIARTRDYASEIRLNLHQLLGLLNIFAPCTISKWKPEPGTYIEFAHHAVLRDALKKKGNVSGANQGSRANPCKSTKQSFKKFWKKSWMCFSAYFIYIQNFMVKFILL